MGSAHEQDEALNKYFLPDAEFIHPLCWVPRFRNVAVPFFGSIDSLWLVQCIYRWYITFAPKLDIVVDSTGMSWFRAVPVVLELHADLCTSL